MESKKYFVDKSIIAKIVTAEDNSDTILSHHVHVSTIWYRYWLLLHIYLIFNQKCPSITIHQFKLNFVFKSEHATILWYIYKHFMKQLSPVINGHIIKMYSVNIVTFYNIMECRRGTIEQKSWQSRGGSVFLGFRLLVEARGTSRGLMI